jgi:DNA modification methylase
MLVGSKLLENIGKVKDYLTSSHLSPLFLQADTYALLKLLPDDCIDCVITSPPYRDLNRFQAQIKPKVSL